MAVGAEPLAEQDVAEAPARARVRHFASLKLRIIGNGMRGRPWRIVTFVLGALGGLWFAFFGFLLLALPALVDRADLAIVVSSFTGTALVLAWLLFPLLVFGVDETLDPARFALLPLPRRTLIAGLLTAALLGVPPLATLAATGGLVLSAALLGGWLAALTQGAGVFAAVLLCVAASRALTSAFATMLRSRRMRDLAAVAIALLAALLGPVQLALSAAFQQADLDRFVGPARLLEWTPWAAPYTVGVDIVEGRAWAVPAKLAITALAIAGLLWWWSSSLESAMIGATGDGPARTTRAARTGGLVTQLFPRPLRWLPRNAFGAVMAREARSWWRDARRRANMITVAVIGVFLPVTLNLSRLDGSADRTAPFSMTMSMFLVGAYAAVVLANQFGFDGTAYAAHLVAGVRGRTELLARAGGFSAFMVPVLVIVGVLVAVILRGPGWLPTMLGAIFAAYGVGVAVNLLVSVLAGYATPESSNPFAMNTGRGSARGLLGIVALLATAVLGAPYLIAAVLAGGTAVWSWLTLPSGVAYGLGMLLLGVYITGDALDRHGPELLFAVDPRK